CATNWDDW
nr:immunoglobulin heavy chain junction region [Mus musculus]